MSKEEEVIGLCSTMRLLQGIVCLDQSLPYVKAIIPLAAALLSAAIFSIAIQLPYRARLVTTPFMIGAAAVAIRTNSYLLPFPHAPDILSQVICVWSHHALSVLLIEPVFIPPNSPPQQRQRFIRKIWNDPRRLTTWESCEESKESTSRLKFLEIAVRRMLFYIALHRFFAAVKILVGPDNLMADDFAPIRRSFFRRMLHAYPEAPVTMRDLHIRAWVSVEWIWTSYIKINTYNVLASIVFVVVLRFDSPEEWPDLFGSPLEAYSVQRFWGKFWHPLLRHPCAASGRLISRRLLRIPAGSRYERIWVVFWTFLVSGVDHALVAHVISNGYSGFAADYLRYKLSHFAAGAIEMVLGPILEKKIRAHQDGPLGRIFANSLVRRLLGYLWVFMVFFCSKPHEQYARLYINLR
ncbi:hypothetical protein DM02DRAFT_649640 [Periconia macrospinosa]|uniref:Wax synthase domain-containing protein n=1 Tax=Periconia macrospinosa TaxID=97972 RepID=A0A2V1E813_9PLEO|nr:hypothetical protein DM02DRAFT_649640 [Periconia macrospinosa]